MNIVDIICIVCIIAFIIFGIQRGFLSELFKLLKWVFTLIGAKLLASPIAGILFSVFEIDSKLRTEITTVVERLSFDSLENLRSSLQTGLGNLAFIGNFIGDTFKNNWGLTDLYQSGVSDIQTKLVDLIMTEITPTALSFVESITFIFLIIILSLILGLVFNGIIKATQSSKLTGSIDKVLGGLFGGIKGVVLIAILLAIIYLVASVTSSEYLLTIEGSRFFDIFNGILNAIPTK